MLRQWRDLHVSCSPQSNEKLILKRRSVLPNIWLVFVPELGGASVIYQDQEEDHDFSI